MVGSCEATEERQRALVAYCATLGDVGRLLLPGFTAQRWSAEEAAVYVRTARARGSASVKEPASGGLLAEVADARRAVGLGVDYDAVRKQGAHVTTVTESLSETDKQALRTDFSGLTEFEFKNSSTGPPGAHGLLAVSKRAMMLQVYRAFSPEVKLLEVGPCPLSCVYRAVQPGKYMGCVPLLEPKDAERWQSKMRAIEVLLRGQGRRKLKPHQERTAKLIVTNPESLFFFGKVQDVVAKAEIVVSFHANWNIPMAAMPVIMQRTGARMWYAVFDRVQTLAVSDDVEGKEETTGIRWKADRARDELTIYFDGCYSQPYRHRLSVVREYMQCVRKEYDVSGYRYVVEECAMSTRMQLVVKCTALGMVSLPASEEPFIRLNQGPPRVRVTIAERNTSVAIGKPGDFVPGVFEIEEDVFARALSDRMLQGKKGNVATVINFSRSNRVTVLYNGVRVQASGPIVVGMFRKFAVAVDAFACDLLAAGEATDSRVRATLNSGGKVFMSTAECAWEAATAPLSPVLRMVNAVSMRLRALAAKTATAGVSRGVQVERVPVCEKLPAAPLCYLEGPARARNVGVCYCSERVNAERLWQDVATGSPEKEVLRAYLDALNRQECSSCKRSGFMEARGAAAREEEEQAEEFFDCSDGSDTDAASDGSTTTSDTVDSETDYSDNDESACDSESEHAVYRAWDDYSGSFGENPGKTRMRMCMEEWAQVLMLQIRSVEDEAYQLFKVLNRSGTVDQRMLSALDSSVLQHALLEVGLDGSLVKCLAKGFKIGDFSRVMDMSTGTFHPVVKRGNVWYVDGRVSKVVYSNTRMKVWNQPAILANISAAFAPGSWLDGPEPIIPFLNGVWGCGKTTGAAKKFEKDKALGRRMFLSATVSGADELRMKLFGSKTTTVAKQYVRTYGSLETWGAKGLVVSELVLDEMAALHAAEVLYVVHLLKPTRVLGMGDFKQMSWKPFVAGYVPRYSSPQMFCDVRTLNTTHRCKTSIAAGALAYYDNKLSVCGCCEHIAASEEGGVKVIRIQSETELPLRKSMFYMGFSQYEKERLRELLVTAGVMTRSEAEENVKTVAEAQGVTKQEVALVRLVERTKPGSLYFEEQRVNVGVSRAKHEVTYYTMSDEMDEVRQFASRCEMEELRTIVRRNTEIENEKWKDEGQRLDYYFSLRDLQYV